jgi:hypothetical protein
LSVLGATKSGGTGIVVTGSAEVFLAETGCTCARCADSGTTATKRSERELRVRRIVRMRWLQE